MSVVLFWMFSTYKRNAFPAYYYGVNFVYNSYSYDSPTGLNRHDPTIRTFQDPDHLNYTKSQIY